MKALLVSMCTRHTCGAQIYIQAYKTNVCVCLSVCVHVYVSVCACVVCVHVDGKMTRRRGLDSKPHGAFHAVLLGTAVCEALFLEEVGVWPSGRVTYLNFSHRAGGYLLR